MKHARISLFAFALFAVARGSALAHCDDDSSCPQFAQTLSHPAHSNLNKPEVKQDLPRIVLVPIIETPVSPSAALPPPRLSRPLGAAQSGARLAGPGSPSGPLTPFEFAQRSTVVRTQQELDIVKNGMFNAVRDQENGIAMVKAIQSNPDAARARGMIGFAGLNVRTALDQLEAYARITAESERASRNLAGTTYETTLKTDLEKTNNLLQSIDARRQ